jgi:hypothetical protein
MATLIRKCANARCADIIGSEERANKKFCSKDCKNKANNDNNKKGRITWDKILDRYNDLPSEPFIPFPKWLKENYYPPRIIKQKK